MDYIVNRRDIDFILKEQIGYDKLLSLPALKDFTGEMFDMIIDQALKIAQQDIAPLNASGDREGAKFDGKNVTTPKGYKELYAKYAENGFIGLDVPTTYGGQGVPMMVTMPVAEFITGASVSFSMYPGLTRGAAHLIEVFGSDELKNTYVAKMYSGQWGGTMCLTEPQAGSAVGDLKTVAVPQADGSYKIKGGKIFISSGDHDLTENIIHLVLARIQGDQEGSTKTISLFAVPKFRVKKDGSLGEPNDVKTVNIEHKMGIKAQATCTLAFGDNDACVGYLVGEPRSGMKQMFQMMNEARLLCGLQGQAVAAVAYEHALKYSKDRIQGQGKAIIAYPDIRRMLVTQKALVEGIRALLFHTALYIDLSKHHPDETERAKYQGFADLLTPMCKSYGSDMGFKVTELAMQTYGGYGYISEYPVEQYMRDVKISSIYEGTNGIQALDLLGRKLALNGGQTVQQFYGMVDEFLTKNANDPALKGEIAEFKKSLDVIAQTAMSFMEMTGKGDFNYPMLCASDFLNMFAGVVIGYFLLDQAVLAHTKLEALLKDKVDEPSQHKSFIKNNDEAAFLDGKIKTARFYVQRMLPQVRATAKVIQSGDRSALEIIL
jgi:alkylation response protein AidB-like acyl-CoA dehydrogenase